MRNAPSGDQWVDHLDIRGQYPVTDLLDTATLGALYVLRKSLPEVSPTQRKKHRSYVTVDRLSA